MIVTLLGCTTSYWANLQAASNGEWDPEGDGTASDLVEFAGRACYQSWSRPNPDTASNAGYLSNIIKQQHYSVLEHGVVSFYIRNVSRSLTHELVRHRHLSYSQLSQRFVKLSETPIIDDSYVVPPLYRADPVAESLLYESWRAMVKIYHQLLDRAEKMGVTNKQAREAARCVLPNMTPTAIVVTGNHRAWRDMLLKRGTIHADAEIRALAVELHSQLSIVEPNIYADIVAVPVDHGQGSVTVLECKS